MAVILFVNLLTLSSVLSYNLDYEYTVAKQGPANSLFGFSVLQHKSGGQNWLVVGAPKGVNKYLNSCTGCIDKDSGTVYKCNATSPSLECEDEVRFDSSQSSQYESKSNEWLGVSLTGVGGDNEVVTCAHRYVHQLDGRHTEISMLEGVCYRVDAPLENPNGKHSPCASLNSGGGGTQTYKKYKYCQAGVGMDNYQRASKDDKATGLLLSAVGSLQAEGKTFRYSEDSDEEWLPSMASNAEKYKDSYFGYAVVVGKFIDSNLEVALGGPRYQSFGKVLIYNDNQFKNKNAGRFYTSDEIKEVPADYAADGIEIGSGFGIALAAIDSDNNGFDELVVGAPFTSSNKKPNVGKVYVYAESSGSLKLKQTLNGIKEHSSFGYAVSNAGDLNLDGFPDLVVGAPHKDAGEGAVFVYQGTNNGFAETPQIIKASDVQSSLASAGALPLTGFGKSLAGGLDLDSNGYKDVLVGSYLSGHAVLLRSRPVIIPHTTMKFTPEQIDATDLNCQKTGANGQQISTACFELSFCHNISESSSVQSGTKSIAIKFKLIADSDNANNPRVYIKDSNVFEFTVTSQTGAPSCYKIKDMYLKFDSDGTIAEYPDVKFKITHEIPYGVKNGVDKPQKDDVSVPSLDNYPILSRMYRDGKYEETDVVVTQLTFKRECVKCIPDLKITSTSSNYTLRPGHDDFPFNVTIENIGVDPAYAVTLKFKLPKNIKVTQVKEFGKSDKQCFNNTCSNVIPKLPKGEKRLFTIFLNTQEIRPEDKYQVNLIVSSLNDEAANTLGDNTLTVGFDTKVVADIELLAVKANQQIAYTGSIKGERAMKNLDEVGQPVNHKYAVRNNGPDLIQSVNLTIYWPYETLSGKHLLYLVSLQTSSRTECDPIDANSARIKSGSSAGNLISRKRRQATAPASNQTVPITDENNPDVITKPVLKPRSGTILGCQEKTANCLAITCRMTNIPSQDSEAIIIRSRLWEPSLLLDYYGEVITVISHGNVILGQNASYLSDPNPNNNLNELFTVINPVLVKAKKKIAVWIIALAVVAGIILLALLIFGLFKLGFFKRNRKPEFRAGAKEPEKSLLSK